MAVLVRQPLLPGAATGTIPEAYGYDAYLGDLGSQYQEMLAAVQSQREAQLSRIQAQYDAAVAQMERAASGSCSRIMRIRQSRRTFRTCSPSGICPSSWRAGIKRRRSDLLSWRWKRTMGTSWQMQESSMTRTSMIWTRRSVRCGRQERMPLPEQRETITRCWRT